MKADKESAMRGLKFRAETAEFQHRLSAYALSAAAAGVAAMACSLNAEAAPICKSSSLQLFEQSAPVNPAGLRIAPFELADTFNNVSSIYGEAWNRGFLTPNAPSASPLLAANHFPAALPSGASIGPRGSFGEARQYGLLFTYGPLAGGTKKKHQGNFDFSQENLFGFKFSISGQPHYGWVRLKVTFGYATDGVATTIHVLEYAYESDPNTAILAGSCSQARGFSPASLGVLARGASGLAARRK